MGERVELVTRLCWRALVVAEGAGCDLPLNVAALC